MASPMKTSVLLPLLLIMFAAVSFGRGTTYPGRASARSPRKTYEIRCVVDKDEGTYTLLIRHAGTRDSRELLSGSRYAELLWQPNESHLAMTDWACSDSATVYIVKLPTGAPKPLESLIDMDTI